MATYTYKIGKGGSETTVPPTCVHSTLIVAATFSQAVEKADQKRRASVGSEHCDRAWLTDDRNMVVWSRPIPAID